MSMPRAGLTPCCTVGLVVGEGRRAGRIDQLGLVAVGVMGVTDLQRWFAELTTRKLPIPRILDDL